MLSPANRLPKQRITTVQREGFRATSAEIILRYMKSQGLPRFAFVVPAKVDKRATQRNRMRRVLSESVRKLLPMMSGADGIFICRKNINPLTQQEIHSIVTELLRTAHIL